MHRFLYVGTEALMEILGPVEPSSPNPRRNTSKDFFDVLRSGDKVATCCKFVADLLPPSLIILNQAATIVQRVAALQVPNLNGR
jgi:hypothetical protein